MQQVKRIYVEQGSNYKFFKVTPFQARAQGQ